MPASSDRGGTPSSVVPKKNLFEDEGSSDDDQEDGGATLGVPSLKINEEFARRFLHNKKREELHRLEEKYKSSKKSNAAGDEDDDESESSSEDEDEDEDAMLVTEDLDAEISATLRAIKNKDPRIYDKNAVFYKPFDAEAALSKEKREKPVTLRDYHRQRYLDGDVGAEEEEEQAKPQKKTYLQEQEELKKSVLSEIRAEVGEEEEWSDDDAFLKPKEGQDKELPAEDGVHPSRAAALKITDLDIANAEKNPEEYLSKFMASKPWAAEEGSKWAAFESDDDDDDEDAKAADFEFAYNIRFEDPEKSNEILKSYSRNVVAERSVRKEELAGRKKQRAAEKERKEAEKRERQEERARLRNLKVEEASERLALIKKAAGLSGKSLKEEEWTKFLDDAWDDDKWEAEMTKRFGEEYYAEEDVLSEGDEDTEGESRKKKPKKPKWDDDIDIKDLVPDFDEESRPNITLSDSDPEEHGVDEDEGDEDQGRPAKKRKTAKDHKKDKINAKREARKERAKLEALIDSKMELDDPTILSSKPKTEMPKFRYRETSPQAFGMTTKDILLAPSDAILNEFAGLKKLATFRDPEKKKKDKKRLGKKARLREWRREAFGKEYEHSGPTFGFEKLLGQEAPAAEEKPSIEDGEKKKRKRKRSKKTGDKAAEA